MFKNVCVIVVLITLIGCSSKEESNSANKDREESIQSEEQERGKIVNSTEAKERLKVAYQLFKESKDAESIAVANEVLKFGKETNNDTLIGGALSSLCRNAQRTLDTTKLGELSAQLKALSESTGSQKWMMKRAHMNAEMWRLIGNMDRAERFYNESMTISQAIGAKGMFMIDHFNKSFVSTEKGDFEEANRLILKYYALYKEAYPEKNDAYGLIAMAFLLDKKGNHEGAHEVATVARRMFKDQNIFPEPPDEKPLLLVEANAKENLEESVYKSIAEGSVALTVDELLKEYL